jgi:hypothetical protein
VCGPAVRQLGLDGLRFHDLNGLARHAEKESPATAEGA